MASLLFVALTSCFWTWTILGILWLFCGVPDQTLKYPGWRHIFLGGPLIWIALVGAVLWLLVLGLYSIAKDMSESIDEWSVRPAERAVEEYKESL